MNALRKALNPAEETLDPDDWAAVQALSHQIVDDAVRYLRDIRDRPVWQDIPAEVKAFFESPLPQGPAPLAEIYREVAENVMAYPMGNIHPRFWSWYMGSSNFTGALGDFLAAIQGSNLGGGNHSGLYGPAGGELVQGDDGISCFGQRHFGQWRFDGEHYWPRRSAEPKGRY
jgi:aromatic-L-amino-acid decarboxylase